MRPDSIKFRNKQKSKDDIISKCKSQSIIAFSPYE